MIFWSTLQRNQFFRHVYLVILIYLRTLIISTNLWCTVRSKSWTYNVLFYLKNESTNMLKLKCCYKIICLDCWISISFFWDYNLQLYANRLALFFRFFLYRTQALEDHEFLEFLPPRLRSEIATHVHLETLQKVFF